MDTPSATTTLLTEPEAAAIVAGALAIKAAAKRINAASYHDSIGADAIRGLARSAEALDSAKDALSNALITLEVYGNCANAERVREAV